MLQKKIRDLSLQKANLQFSNCQEEGHMKDTCRHETIHVIQTHHFCENCREITQHLTMDFPYNLRKQKKCWCTICEEATHNTTNCDLNTKNHRVVYKTEVVPNDQGQSTNFRSNHCNPRGGYNGRGRYNIQGGYNNQV